MTEVFEDSHLSTTAAPITERIAPPDFFIFGSPRSGTTLATRLCAELTDVHVMFEAHFFERITHSEVWRRFPHDEAALRRLVAIMDAAPFGSVNADHLVAALGGIAHSPAELLAGIVRADSGGRAVVGEKTPQHVQNWRTLHEWYPDARFIGLVRDPRHQVASQRTMSWGTRSVLRGARRWQLASQHLLSAREQLGSDVVLLVHHDEMVRDPTRARAQMADHLGVDAAEVGQPSIDDDRRDHSAFQEIDPDRATHRAAELSMRQQRTVATICSQEMIALQLDPGVTYPEWTRTLLVLIAAAAEATHEHFVRGRRRVRRAARSRVRRVQRALRSR